MHIDAFDKVKKIVFLTDSFDKVQKLFFSEGNSVHTHEKFLSPGNVLHCVSCGMIPLRSSGVSIGAD